MIGYYVTIVRDRRTRYLAGPYKMPPTSSDVDLYAGKAIDYDPWTVFDLFGVSKVTGHQLPAGIFNRGES